MFSLNENVVYPGIGVAKINRIIEKKVGGSATQFFELFFIHRQMTILVPVNNISEVGVRHLTKRSLLETILKILQEPVQMVSQDPSLVNWNKRNKEYQGKISTGNLHEIAEIYRDLVYLSRHKELSFGEKKLLQQTQSLLTEEIAIVFHIDHTASELYLHEMARLDSSSSLYKK